MRLLLLVGIFFLIIEDYMVFGKWHEGPYYDDHRKVSDCERNVKNRRNYLNGYYDLSLNQISKVLLGDFLYTARFKQIFINTPFQRLAEALGEPTFTNWSPLNDSWYQRNISFGREVYDQPLIKHADLSEIHKASFTSKNLILNKIVRNMDIFLKGMYMNVDYCVVPLRQGGSHVEVDVDLVIENPLLALLGDSIKATASDGFVEVYGSLDMIFKYLEKNQNDPVLSISLDGIKVPKDIDLRNATILEDHDNSTWLSEIPKEVLLPGSEVKIPGTIPSPTDSGSFMLYFKHSLMALIVVAFLATLLYIAIKIPKIPSHRLANLHCVDVDGFETIDLNSMSSTRVDMMKSPSPVRRQRY